MSKVNGKKTEMCQNLLTERIVQNVVKIIVLFDFFPYNKLSVIRKDPFLSVVIFLAKETLIFKEMRYFLYLLELWGLLLIKFGKSSDKHRYRE